MTPLEDRRTCSAFRRILEYDDQPDSYAGAVRRFQSESEDASTKVRDAVDQLALSEDSPDYEAGVQGMYEVCKDKIDW